MQTTVREIALHDIRLDADTQARVVIDTTTVSEYAEAYRAGKDLPPAIVFHDGEVYYLADGYHRHKARQLAGHETLLCEVRDGTKSDAQWYAAGANQTHGLRRTNVDKRKAITVALRARPDAADREIGEHCGVDHKTVSKVRQEQGPSGETPQMRTVSRRGKTYKQNTSRIGRSKRLIPSDRLPAPAPATAPPEASAATTPASLAGPGTGAQRSLFPADVVEDATPPTACPPAVGANKSADKQVRLAAKSWLSIVESQLNDLGMKAHQSQKIKAADRPAAAAELLQQLRSWLSELTARDPEFLTMAGSTNAPQEVGPDGTRQQTIPAPAAKGALQDV